MLEQTIGPGITLVIRSELDLHPAWIDPNQLELAILNLALNARDAMPEGGVLRINVENRQGSIGSLRSELRPFDYVVISVTDTGIGMNKENLQRAFEPFFTTKEAGRGSGLGLSIVHGFAAQSGGLIEIASTPGEGTKVDLWLPRAESKTPQSVAPDPGPSILEPSHARILVCDDDSGVLTLVATVLRDNGHLVWEADTPSEALAIVEREQPLDLLLVDYVMPGMNGIAVINRARACQRELKAILMSGHADALRTGGASGIPLLAKPFKVAELRQRICEVLLVPSPNARFGFAGTKHSTVSTDESRVAQRFCKR